MRVIDLSSSDDPDAARRGVLAYAEVDLRALGLDGDPLAAALVNLDKGLAKCDAFAEAVALCGRCEPPAWNLRRDLLRAVARAWIDHRHADLVREALDTGRIGAERRDAAAWKAAARNLDAVVAALGKVRSDLAAEVAAEAEISAERCREQVEVLREIAAGDTAGRPSLPAGALRDAFDALPVSRTRRMALYENVARALGLTAADALVAKDTARKLARRRKPRR